MLSRGGWVLVALAAVSAGALGPSGADSLAALQSPHLSTALIGLGSLVQLALSAWVLVVAGLVLCRAPASVLRALTPPLLRRALFAGAVGVLAVSPSHAETELAPSGSSHDVAGLRLPDRPVGAVVPPRVQPATVVVRPGDTLWAIAARSLPAGATAAEIASACARWHDTNRDVIGDDPDLIFPTQRLVPPAGKDPA